jgi:hypothetical protein
MQPMKGQKHVAGCAKGKNQFFLCARKFFILVDKVIAIRMTHFAGENWNGNHLPAASSVYGPAEVPFSQIWNQENPAAYNDLIGFQDLAIWPRSQVGNFVSQRLSSPRTALTPSNSSSNPTSTERAKKTRRRVATIGRKPNCRRNSNCDLITTPKSTAQRRAANIRERRRMFNLNEGKTKRAQCF